jgi:hypothetical protein
MDRRSVTGPAAAIPAEAEVASAVGVRTDSAVAVWFNWTVPVAAGEEDPLLPPPQPKTIEHASARVESRNASREQPDSFMGLPD